MSRQKNRLSDKPWIKYCIMRDAFFLFTGHGRLGLARFPILTDFLLLFPITKLISYSDVLPINIADILFSTFFIFKISPGN